MSVYKVGLVGLGEIAPYFVRGVQLNPKTRLVAVCKRNKTQKDVDKYKDCRFYTNWKDLVSDKEVNAIIIATPPSTHAEISNFALERRKKVIVEKPYSLNLRDAFLSVEIAEKNNTHLYFAYHAAFNPMSLLAKEKISSLISAGEKIASFKVIFREDVRNYHGANSWIFEPKAAGGGCLIDSGINAISVVEHIGIGHVLPTDVTFGFDPKFKVEISAKVLFRSASDPSVVGELDQDWLYTGKEKREITVYFASGKVLSFDYTTGDLIITSNDKSQSETHRVQLRESNDAHSTPMGMEYIGIIDDAVEFFQKKEIINKLGVGPFETIMLAYDFKDKAKL